jgi:hypothetical protein
MAAEFVDKIWWTVAHWQGPDLLLQILSDLDREGCGGISDAASEG